MAVNPQDLRVGDRVLVEMEVAAPENAGHSALKFGNGIEEAVAFVRPENIHSILPRPLAVGDRVKPLESERLEGPILHIHGAHAWVHWENGDEDCHTVWRLSSLERAS